MSFLTSIDTSQQSHPHEVYIMCFTTSVRQSPFLKEGSIEGAPETLGTQLRRQVGLNRKGSDESNLENPTSKNLPLHQKLSVTPPIFPSLPPIFSFCPPRPDAKFLATVPTVSGLHPPKAGLPWTCPRYWCDARIFPHRFLLGFNDNKPGVDANIGTLHWKPSGQKCIDVAHKTYIMDHIGFLSTPNT